MLYLASSRALAVGFMGMRDPSPLSKIIVQAYLPADPTIAVIGGGNGHSCAPSPSLLRQCGALSGPHVLPSLPLVCTHTCMRMQPGAADSSRADQRIPTPPC